MIFIHLILKILFLFKKIKDFGKSEEEKLKEKELRREAIRNKIKAVARLSRVFKVLREERETITELKKKMGTDNLPAGLLNDGAAGIRNGMLSFFSFFFSFF